MRLSRVLTSIALAVAAISVSSQVQAGSTETSAGGTIIDASASVGGSFGGFPSSQGIPCADGSSRKVRPWQMDIAGTTLPVSTRVVNGVTQTHYEPYCEDGSDTGGLLGLFWAAPPTAGPLVLPLFDIAAEALKAPQTFWPNMSPEHGWLFVKVPMDFRVHNVGFVLASANVANPLGSASAWVRATPTTLTFSSGDGAGAGSATCTIEQGREAYVPRSPGACAFTYLNSSATAANGYSFEATMTVTFAITSNPVNNSLPATLTTSTNIFLPVSEFQSIVTCYGNNC